MNWSVIDYVHLGVKNKSSIRQNQPDFIVIDSSKSGKKKQLKENIKRQFLSVGKFIAKCE